MEFNGLQLAAMVNAGMAMILADGKIQADEMSVGLSGIKRFAMNDDDFQAILQRSKSLKRAEMISILSSMTNEQKKYVYGYLVTIMASDKDIDQSEAKLLQLISDLADFPQMSMTDAAAFWLGL